MLTSKYKLKYYYWIYLTHLFLFYLLYCNVSNVYAKIACKVIIWGVSFWNTPLTMASISIATIQWYIDCTSTTWSVRACSSNSISWWVVLGGPHSSSGVIQGWTLYKIIGCNCTHTLWTNIWHTMYILWQEILIVVANVPSTSLRRTMAEVVTMAPFGIPCIYPNYYNNCAGRCGHISRDPQINHSEYQDITLKGCVWQCSSYDVKQISSDMMQSSAVRNHSVTCLPLNGKMERARDNSLKLSSTYS